MKRNIRRIAGRLLTGGLFLAGFLVFAYPILAGNLTDRAMTEALERFDSMKENVSGQEIREDGDENQMEENRKQNKLYEEMQKYMQRFKEIEDISPEEVQSNMGFYFFSL